jgi:hypothetical protein
VDLPEESPERATSSRPEAASSAKADRPDPSRLRASDADRDRVADQLREALAEGRLTPEEHAERLDAVYAAKTYAELAPVVADLPGMGEPAGPPTAATRHPAMEVASGGGAALPVPARPAATIVAIFGGAERKGRWLVEQHTTVTAVFGGIDLDLRQAVLSQREVTITVTCVMGGVELTVPPGVRVINSVAAVLGGVQIPGDDSLEPDAPVIRLTGLALFGGIDVKRRPANPANADAVGSDFRERQRETHREFNERTRDVHRELRQKHRELRELRRTERRQRRHDR